MPNFTLPLPKLTFESVLFNPKEVPWDLTPLLFQGGSEAHRSKVADLIKAGKLGEPIPDRFELVSEIHAEMSSDLTGGGSRNTAENVFRVFRLLFSFADSNKLAINKDSLVSVYCLWADHMYTRTRLKKQATIGGKTFAPITMQTAYKLVANIGSTIDSILDRNSRIIELTKLVHQTQRKAPVSHLAEKQNLEETFSFGHLISDICDALTLDVLTASTFPIEIQFRTEKKFTFEKPYFFPSSSYPNLIGKQHLANLRIEAELFMFIAQTGMNISQAKGLGFRNFVYVSHLDGYQVKEYKARRGGMVLFEIFKDYRCHFERYLDWRRNLFPGSDFLFPFIVTEGGRQESRFQGERVRKICNALDIVSVPPSLLRSTRINWLLRKSANPDLTSEMAQHTKATLLGVYERPSLQRALVESTRFWATKDFVEIKTEAVAPGDCTGVAKPVEDLPKEAPKPDCVRPSGCLWCENHRDVDSFEYLWALSSFKHLKAIELTKATSPLVNLGVPPAYLVIERLNSKLRWFEQSNDVRKGWVAEAEARIAEGNYHHYFDIEILELEGWL